MPKSIPVYIIDGKGRVITIDAITKGIWVTQTATKPRTPAYDYIEDSGAGTTKTLVTPSSGKTIYVACIVISTTAAGVVEIKFGDTTKIHLEFNERKSVPLAVPFEVEVGKDLPLKGYFKSDAGTHKAYFTVFYDERDPYTSS